MLTGWAAFAALPSGLVLLFVALFLYEDEARAVQARLEATWIRLDDAGGATRRALLRFSNTVGVFTESALNRLFGERAVSLQSISSAVNLGCLSLLFGLTGPDFSSRSLGARGAAVSISLIAITMLALIVPGHVERSRSVLSALSLLTGLTVTYFVLFVFVLAIPLSLHCYTESVGDGAAKAVSCWPPFDEWFSFSRLAALGLASVFATGYFLSALIVVQISRWTAKKVLAATNLPTLAAGVGLNVVLVAVLVGVPLYVSFIGADNHAVFLAIAFLSNVALAAAPTIQLAFALLLLMQQSMWPIATRSLYQVVGKWRNALLAVGATLVLAALPEAIASIYRALR